MSDKSAEWDALPSAVQRRVVIVSNLCLIIGFVAGAVATLALEAIR